MAHSARGTVASAGAGVASVVFGVGVGELLGAVLGSASPVTAVGGWLIDLAPPWAKDTAIAWFGTADKIALVVGICIVLVAAGAAIGVLEHRRPPWGRAAFLAVGAIGAFIAMTRPGAGGGDWVPALAAGIGAAAAVGIVASRIPRPVASVAPVASASVPGASAPSGSPVSGDASRTERMPEAVSANVLQAEQPPATELLGTPEPPARRTFLAWALGATAAGALAAAGGFALRAGSEAAAATRRALRLPDPATPAAPVPAGAELDIPGLAPVVTPNDVFYRIDTALSVPQLAAEEWSLRIHGMVEQEVVITWDELLALPLEESYTTLTCVSNGVGGDLIGNALWLGYPIRELLARAMPTADADMVLSRSSDGFTASTPLEVLTDDRNAILAVGMNGTPLPAEHGFPVRMVVPGLYGYVSATKWVVELLVTRFDQDRAYWSDRGWTERGPIKLQSRIDVPKREQGLSAGETVIAGVAWQQHVGVAGVEVQIDEGDWIPATLATPISDDTWVQWSIPWTATTGDHLIRCRAISSDGEVQTDAVAPPAPDGATGRAERFITVF